MKRTRKVFCALLVAALLVLSVVPAYAASVDTSAMKVYMGGKDKSDWGWGSFDINDMKPGDKVTEVKSSNKSVVKIVELDMYQSTYQYYEGDESTQNYINASIGFSALKPGTATITFKVNGKKYSKKITVVGYANPIKTFKLTGVSKTNLKSKFAKKTSVEEKLKADAKAGYLEVSAASGWKVISAEFSDETDSYEGYSFYSSKGVNAVKIAVPKMLKKGRYYVWLNFRNTSTKATQQIMYRLRG